MSGQITIVESVFSAHMAREPFSPSGISASRCAASWMLVNNERMQRYLASGIRPSPILLAKEMINDDAHSRPYSVGG